MEILNYKWIFSVQGIVFFESCNFSTNFWVQIMIELNLIVT